MDEVLRDVRFACRTLAKSPGFTLIVVLTLGLGIGANAAIFSLMDQVLFRPLQVENPEELFILDAPGAFSGSSHSNSNTLTPMSHAMFEALRDRNTVFQGVLCHYPTPVHLTVDGETTNIHGDLVSGTFFDVLGISAAAGRLLGPEDDRVPGAHPVAVLGHGFWTRRFAQDPGVVGRRVLVNNHPMTIVGVAPKGFHGIEVGASADVFLPVMMQPQVIPTWTRGLRDFRVRWVTAVARLKTSVSVSEATAGIDTLYRQLLEEDIKTITTISESSRARFLAKKLALLPGARGTSELRTQSGRPLVVLMSMVGLLLAIACGNVANLLLARASSRQREVAVRLALGASRARLVRQLLVESTILSLAGGLFGIVLALWTSDLWQHVILDADAARALSAEPDLRVGLFAFALSFVTSLLFGLVPALQSTRPALAPTLKNEAGAVISGSSSFRMRKGLVVAQVALSLLLLVGAGLFTRSLQKLRDIDPGFLTERLMAFSLDPSLNGYPLARRIEVLKRIHDEVAAAPGVRSASFAEIALMTSSEMSSTVSVEGYTPKDGENMNPNFNGVSAGFFATLGIPVMSGRDFTDADRAGAPRVAIVNQTFARYFFGDQDALGRRFGLGRGKQNDVTIVGLVKDGKQATLREKPIRFVYMPYTQSTDLGYVTFYVRSAGDPQSLATGLRKAVERVDPTLPVTEMKTMDEQIGESLVVERMVASLSTTFGFLATLLAALGLYGLTSYAVSFRTREIGIRMALGAERRKVLSLVLNEVAALTTLGVFVGLPGAYFLGRLVESQLFGVSARDPMTLTIATLGLLAIATVAGYLPAARAARVSPVVALRYE